MLDGRRGDFWWWRYGVATVTLVGDTKKEQGQAADRQALAHLKQVLWPKAYREQDPVLLDRILADEFRSIDGDGNWSTKHVSGAKRVAAH